MFERDPNNSAFTENFNVMLLKKDISAATSVSGVRDALSADSVRNSPDVFEESELVEIISLLNDLVRALQRGDSNMYGHMIGNLPEKYGIQAKVHDLVNPIQKYPLPNLS